MFYLLVGPKRKKFVAHKDLIAHIVPHFTTASSTEVADSESDEIHLVKAPPAVIQLFIGWLYRGPSALEVKEKQPVHLFLLYALAATWHQDSAAEHHHRCLDQGFLFFPRPSANPPAGEDVLLDNSPV